MKQTDIASSFHSNTKKIPFFSFWETRKFGKDLSGKKKKYITSIYDSPSLVLPPLFFPLTQWPGKV